MILRIILCATVVSAWSTPQPPTSRNEGRRLVWPKTVGSAVLAGLIAASPVHADQIGVEKEAPTLYTGETVEVG